MTGCSVPNCKNRVENGKSFYSIPFGKSVMRRRLQWLLRMGRDKPASRNARICEDHFTPDQFERYVTNGRKKLRCNAVPSIFPSKECTTNGSAPASDVSNGAVQVEGVPQSESEMPSGSVQPRDNTALRDNEVPGDKASVSCSAEPNYGATSYKSTSETSAAPSIRSVTHLNTNSDSAPAQNSAVATVQDVTMGMQQQTTLVLQDTGASTPTYAVTYIIPNHGAFALTSHVAVPASSLLPTQVLQNQPPSLLKPAEATSSPTTTCPAPRERVKTLRERELERKLDLERKKRRKAEMERDELRRSLKRLLADDQVRALEKGTMRGSSWSRGTIQKALQLKVICGGRVYDYVKKYVVPLPAQRTLQQLVEQMKAADGDECEDELSAYDDDGCDDVA